MPVLRAALTLLCLLSLGCGSDPTAAGPRTGIRFASGVGTADTIGARLAEPLVVEVTDSAGRPLVDVEVRFSSPIEPAAPYCTLSACGITGSVFAGGPQRTDATGRVTAVLTFGRVAGPGRLAVSVPALGTVDTARFTIRPGLATRVVLAPRDTALFQGATATLRPVAADRFGNARPETPSLEGSSATPVSGQRVTAAAYGSHRVVARAGALTDTARVAVIPRATVVGIESYAPDNFVIVVVDLDGTKRARLHVGEDISGLAWVPDGSRFVYAKQERFGFRLYSAAPGGSPMPVISAPATTDEQWPTYTRDGQWLYFGDQPYTSDSWQIWRVRPNGTGAQRVGRPVAATFGTKVGMLAPSPDGSQVAYPYDGCCPTARWLQVMDAATGAVVTLPIQADAARWSPTGDRIAYRRPTGAGIVNADGTGNRHFTEAYHGSASISLDWSPDGRWLLHQNGGALQLIDVASGDRIALPQMGGVYMARWRP